MYTLYFLPDACSLATQVVLRELGQEVNLIHKQQVSDFSSINPVGTVPVLHDQDNGQTLREGAAIMIHLLEKHPIPMLPQNDANARLQAIRNIMFANATMHPAYSRLFFASSAIHDADARQAFFATAANAISALWQVVEDQLQEQPFLGGAQPSAADIMLSVYSRWGAGFPVNIQIGEKASAMIDRVLAMDSFKQALKAEQHAAEALS